MENRLHPNHREFRNILANRTLLVRSPQVSIRCLTSLILAFPKIHVVRSANRCLTGPLSPLTPVILILCTVYADDDHEGPTSYVRSENLTFEEAERRIDEIAKVIQLAIPFPFPDHASVLEACAWECTVEGEDHH